MRTRSARTIVTAGLGVLLLLYGLVSFPAQVSASYGEDLLKWGSRGAAVSSLQRDLTALGYNTFGVDGIFGANTYKAVVQFQKSHGLTADGMVGIKTKNALSSAIAANGNQTPSPAQKGYGEMADWWTSASQVFAIGDIAVITDLDTGLTYRVKRTGGSKHADCQPLTSQDTAAMLKAYGGQWAWTRHAILVSIDGRVLAASQNGMPHGGDSIYDNNFAGHFCIHFLNSRTHGTDNLDPAHQAMVRKAAGLSY